MSEKMKNLVVRTLSGVVIAAVVLGAVAWSQWSFGALFALLTIGGMLEFYTLAEARGIAPQKLVGVVAGLLLFALNFALASENQTIYQLVGGLRGLFVCGAALLLLLLPAVFICELYRKQENPLANIAATFAGVIYVALPFALMCYFPIIASDSWQPGIVFGFVFVIWANDVFAYLVGMTIGRHKLFERLSPKKSWEGFFGGLIGAVGMGLLAAWLLDASLCAWAGLAVVASVTGVLGDLVESMFKRASDVKDAGSLIPGHGGVLDRFDAMLIAAPFVFVYLLFVL